MKKCGINTKNYFQKFRRNNKVHLCTEADKMDSIAIGQEEPLCMVGGSVNYRGTLKPVWRFLKTETKQNKTGTRSTV